VSAAPIRPVLVPTPAPEPERPIGVLFSELARETTTLLRQEAELARYEMADKAAEAAVGGAFVGAGGALFIVAGLLVAVTIVAALSLALPVWLASLIVGVVFAAAGFGLLTTGIARVKAIDPRPRRTIRTLKEDERWAKNEMKA